jgi:carbonic anhydrase/acetyltransferase-like protein (isoleucine patch superfamily)
MTRMPHPLILTIRGHSPLLHAESWVAPNASVIGQVTLAARASVWYGATLRAEAEPIEIGFGTNIQDGVTIHVDSEFPVSIGAGVSVGRNAVLHGCVVEDDALIGMGPLSSTAPPSARALWSRRARWSHRASRCRHGPW